MRTIIPAIIPESKEHLMSEMQKVLPVTESFQVDIVDGLFTPHTSWPYLDQNSSLLDLAPIVERYDIGFDLMIRHPEKIIKEWAALRPSRIALHMGSTQYMNECIASIRSSGGRIGIGIALQNGIPLSVLEEYINDIDYVQLMGIEKIGQQGSPFDERVISRCRTLKEMYPHIAVSIDGSMNKETIPLLQEVGADRFVVGSGLFGADAPRKMFAELQGDT